MCSNVAMISDLWRREVGGTQITHTSNIGQTPQDLSWYPMLEGEEFFKLISQPFTAVPHRKRHDAVILGVCHCCDDRLAIIIIQLFIPFDPFILGRHGPLRWHRWMWAGWWFRKEMGQGTMGCTLHDLQWVTSQCVLRCVLIRSQSGPHSVLRHTHKCCGQI